jgi:hypothetical protein
MKISTWMVYATQPIVLDRKAILDHKAFKEYKEYRATRGFKGLKEILESTEPMVCKDRKEYRVFKAFKAFRVSREKKEIREIPGLLAPFFFPDFNNPLPKEKARRILQIGFRN